MKMGFWAICWVLMLSSGVLAADSPSWMRYPAISPDGNTVAFTYQGDLYRVSAKGGDAVPLTLSDSYDYKPVWSPDGQWIAFASERSGNFDLYIIPAQGGQPVRLTYNSTPEVPMCFTPDSKKVLFTASILDAATNFDFPAGYLPEIYQVGVTGGAVEQVLSVRAINATWSRDGKLLVFEDRKSAESTWRKHHRSSATRDIYSWDPNKSKIEKLTTFDGEDTDPVLSGDGQTLFYLSESAGSFNVFQQNVHDPASAKALTQFNTHPVRFLSIASTGQLCFGYHGAIFTLTPGATPEQLLVRIPYRDRNNEESPIQTSDEATEMAISPSGKELAFVWRGDVFATSTSSPTVKQITHTAQEERSISFSPDGKSILYSGFREGTWNLYRSQIVRTDEPYFFQATLFQEETLLATHLDEFQGVWSPDGKEIAYLEQRTALRVLNLESKKSRTLIPAHLNFSYGDNDLGFEWSPDGQYLLFNYQLPTSMISEVGLIKSDATGQIVNLSRSGFYDGQPRFSHDGQAVIWLSAREGLRSSAFSGEVQVDTYALFLTQKAFDRYNLSKDEFELLKEKEAEAKPEDQSKGETSKPKAEDAAKKSPEAKTPPEKVTIEWEGLFDRRVRLSLHSASLNNPILSFDGETLYYLAKFEKGYNIWKSDLRTKETKIFAPVNVEQGSLVMSSKGDVLYLFAEGAFSKIDLTSGEAKPIPYKASLNLDENAERHAMFEHVRSTVVQKFYLEKLPVDWNSLCDAYASKLGEITHSFDMAELLNELLGELNVSHTGANYVPKQQGESSGCLGLYFDPSFSGPGLKIQEILAKNPILKDSSNLKPGYILEKVNGILLDARANLDQLLLGKANTYILLSLLDPTTQTRYEERVKPFDTRLLRKLTYERWVERNRAKVEELSNGRLAYVHVRGMNDPSFRTVIEELLGIYQHLEAVIVDTRYNTGGDLVSDLNTFLSGKPAMKILNRDGRQIGTEPQMLWNKPSVVLMSEGNYSDAHCFPTAYKDMERGKLIGMPVPGTCTFVWGESLQNPEVSYSIPILSVTNKKGEILENLQLNPDIRVENNLFDMAQGQDPQLATAVATLLADLDAKK